MKCTSIKLIAFVTTNSYCSIRIGNWMAAVWKFVYVCFMLFYRVRSKKYVCIFWVKYTTLDTFINIRANVSYLYRYDVCAIFILSLWASIVSYLTYLSTLFLTIKKNYSRNSLTSLLASKYNSRIIIYLTYMLCMRTLPIQTKKEKKSWRHF